MKKLNTLLWVFTILMLISNSAEAQMQVRDRHKNNQLKREVYEDWGNFTPKVYFWLFHNKYRKGPDRRNLLQLAPTVGALTLNENKAENQKLNTDSVTLNMVKDFANRELMLQYELHYKEKIAEAANVFQDEWQRLNSSQPPPEIPRFFHDRRVEINDRVKIIADGLHTRGEQNKGFQDILGSYYELIGEIRHINKIASAVNKYTVR